MIALSTMQRNLGPASTIPLGEGRRYQVDGVEIAVFRSRNGAIYATQASCPHQRGPLEDGLLGGTTLICPFHARKFDLETGQSLSDECSLRTYRINLDDNGDLILALDPGDDLPAERR